jgi:hypothetical protein
LFLAFLRQNPAECRHFDSEPWLAGLTTTHQLGRRINRVQVDHGVVAHERGVRRAFGAQQHRNQVVGQCA